MSKDKDDDKKEQPLLTKREALAAIFHHAQIVGNMMRDSRAIIAPEMPDVREASIQEAERFLACLEKGEKK